MEHLNTNNFKDFISQKGLVLVDFWAGWCGPCRMLAPVLEELETKLEIKIGKVDVDAEGLIASAFNVESIPTLYLFKDGKAISKAMGYRPLEDLINWINTVNQ